MGEVVASVAVVEAGAKPPSGDSVPTSGDASKGLSFVDGESGADAADAILDEVLTGEKPADEGAPPADAAKPADKPAPVVDAPQAEPIEAARLRKGFAKLGEDRQKLIEQQNALRAERATVSQFQAKAEAHDRLVARLNEDPAGVIAEMGDEAVTKALQGFIDREKSPAEREVAKLRAESDRDKAAAKQAEMEKVAADWRAGITRQVQADDRFDLVNTFNLHGDVIDVITRYYEVHSEKDDKGNVIKPAILPWDIAAEAVETNKAKAMENSKRYGKRAPAAVDPKKDTPPAKTPTAPAKKPPTSLSSVPVAETPPREEDFATDDMNERERQVLASMGL